MNKFVLYIFLLLVFSLSPIMAADTLSGKLSSYEGLNFIIGFMENESSIADPVKLLEQKIFITSSKDANVEISFGNLQPPTKVKVPSNQVVDLDVPITFENTESEVIRKSLIEINSDVPISVYCFSSIPRSTDSYTAIPVANWGKEYRIVSIANDQYNKVTLDSIKDLTPRSSEFMVMAAYDGTEVLITPKSLTRKIKQVDQSYMVVLNKGESYLVQSWQYTRGQGDLSGSIIKANKPIGVLSGHVRTALLQGFVEQPPDSKDHLIEMLPPMESWGKNYITTPFGTSPNKGDYFKIISKDPETKIALITNSGVEEINFIGNETIKVVTGINSPAQWIATAPILLTQFMYRTDDTLESHYYDPSMVVVPPIEQFVSKIILQTPAEVFQYVDGEKFSNHYVNIIADSVALSTLMYNNISVKSISNIEKQRVLSTNMYWARLSLGRGKHVIKSDSGRFSGVIFGIGRYDSYAMALGSSLQNPFVDDKIPPELSYKDSCDCLVGEITDLIAENSYGIYYAFIRKDLTSNYNVTFSAFSPDMTKITFRACPEDLYKDGRLVIEYMDKNGNTKLFDYNYYAKNLAYQDKLLLGSINSKDSLCLDYIITNNGQSNQTIENFNIFGDNRIHLYSSISMPYIIKPGETINVTICAAGRGDTSAITGNLALNFGCEIRDTIPIVANVVAIDLKVEPYDFGNVMIGDTVCNYVKLINNSNIAVTINNVDFNVKNLPFYLDTLGMFPFTIGAGDTLLVSVCYTPYDRESSIVDIKFNTEYSISVKTFAQGAGVAPRVSSIEIDWKKRRVGTINDSTAEFSNTGNMEAILNFLNFINKSQDDSNTQKISAINNFIINSASLSKIDFSYSPSVSGDYLIESEFSTNWKLHQNVILTLKGNGTIPIINTNDVLFADTEIYKTRDTIAAIITNTGNETLAIDSIIPVSGDINSFVIDYNLLKNLKIAENNKLDIPIQFKPIKLGYHELILEVTHDANPNYQRSSNYIKVSGTAIEPAETNIEISIVTKQSFVCLLDTAIVKIRNKGNENVDITNLQIQKSDDIVRAEILDFVPITITPNEEKSYKVLIYTEKDRGGNVKIIATFFEKLEKFLEFDYYPIVNELIIGLDENVKYAAGDTVTITLNGKYPNRTDRKVNFYLKMDIRNDFLYLIDYPKTVDIVSNEGTQKINLTISQNNEFIEFTSDEIINLNSPSEWNFDLKFVGLLSPTKDSVWQINFSSEKCFETSEKNLNTKLNDVCVFNVRHIQLITNIFMGSVYPNPIKNQINLRVVMPDDDNVEVEIFNENGEKIGKNEIFSLKKGIHFVSLDFCCVPNGWYFLNIRKKDKVNSLKFVKIN